MDKLSYALGLSMGNNFKGSGIQELNVDDFAAAVRSVYDGSKPEMTIDEAKQVVTEFFTELEKRQVEMNREVGKRFLEENAKKEGVKVSKEEYQEELNNIMTGYGYSDEKAFEEAAGMSLDQFAEEQQNLTLNLYLEKVLDVIYNRIVENVE